MPESVGTAPSHLPKAEPGFWVWGVPWEPGSCFWGVPWEHGSCLWGVPLRNCLAQEAAWQGIREAVRGVHGPRCDHLSWTIYLMLLYFSIDLPEESQSQTAASNFACFYLLNFFVISGIFSLMLSIRYIKKFLGLFPKAQISRCLCRPSDLSIWGQKPGMLSLFLIQ